MKLTKRQRQIRRAYTSTVGNAACLTVCWQSFVLCSGCAPSRQLAAHYRDMLAIALDKVISLDACGETEERGGK